MSYPKKWETYDYYMRMYSPAVFGFKADVGDINRFGARFRAARSFRGVVLDGYSIQTATGYSALCRVMFVWSAFESFLRVLDVKQEDSGPLLEVHGGKDALAKLKQLDQAEGFYNFVYERVNKRHRTELDLYRNDNPCNIGYLASAIRHIFAHGHLTPNVNQVEPEKSIQICNELSEFLLRVMDDEFENRVNSFRQ